MLHTESFTSMTISNLRTSAFYFENIKLFKMSFVIAIIMILIIIIIIIIGIIAAKNSAK